MKYIYLIFFLSFSLYASAQENNLLGQWYLHSTFFDDTESINSYEPSFNINFSSNDGTVENYKLLDGGGICNSYLGEYVIESSNSVTFINFGHTLADCHPFENSYLLFFNESIDAPMLLSYSISGLGNDESLVITDQDGDYIVYGRQALSVSENEFNKLSIRLKENPVKDELILNRNTIQGSKFNAQILSIDGKVITKNQVLENNIINVSYLNAGIYFLKFTTENNFNQILKFIKL